MRDFRDCPQNCIKKETLYKFLNCPQDLVKKKKSQEVKAKGMHLYTLWYGTGPGKKLYKVCGVCNLPPLKRIIRKKITQRSEKTRLLRACRIPSEEKT